MTDSTELEGQGWLLTTHKLLNTFLHYILNYMDAEEIRSAQLPKIV